MIKSSIDFVNLIQNIKQNNADQINQNKDSLVRELKSLGLPVGVETQALQGFWKSYNAGPIGPGGKYPVYDSKGRLQYFTDFNNLWWKMFNIPTVEDQQQSALRSDLNNAKTDYSQAKAKALELIQQEKYDDANAIIGQYGIQISPQDFDQYHIPLTQRIFDSLPGKLKAQFAPRVFPQQ
jgi:hypothetical protein